MKRIKSGLATLATLSMTASPAVAQSNDWNYAASLYLFTPETNLSAGGIDASLSFSDALKNLDMAFMAAFEANNGRWGFLADYMLTDLSFGNDTPGPVFGGVNAAMKTQVLSGYAMYRVLDDTKSRVDLAAGFRWFSTKTDLTLLPGVSPGRSVSVSENWTDPVVGARVNFDISEKWTGTAFADYGGFSSDSETWQVLLTADYKINDRWTARVGYRTLSVDHKLSSGDFKFKQSGPIFGATYNF